MTVDILNTQQLDHLSIKQLPGYFNTHDIQLIYTAKNPAWQFNILSNEWQLGTKHTLYLDFINELKIPVTTWIALRVILASQAEIKAFGTVQGLLGAIKAIGDDWQDNLKFQAAFNKSNDTCKRKLISYFRELNKSYLIELLPLKEHFKDVINFIKKQSYPNAKKLKGIFDPEKGIYTEEEVRENHEKLRLNVSKLLKKFKNDEVPSLKLFGEFEYIIGLLLMVTIYRRPIQLSMMKWSDILPVDISFKEHKYSRHSPTPELDSEFSDIAMIHLRTFKAKRGYGFREYAEFRSHRLEAEFSKLIGIYRHFYKLLLSNSLSLRGIDLTEEELEEILSRCPLFPEQQLFTLVFSTKNELFSAIGHQSDSMHPISSNLIAALKRASKKLSLSSSRIDNFNISNNRSRHTVITNAIEKGLSVVQAAAITGVTPGIVSSYTNLDISSRIAIDEAMAGHKVLEQFTRINLSELKSMDGFVVKNEFDDVQGTLRDDNSCQSCQSKICKPLGCYGCGNFSPFWEADHQSNLAKIEQKIAFNTGSAPDKLTLKKLEISRLYCQATISLINEVKLSEKGINCFD